MAGTALPPAAMISWQTSSAGPALLPSPERLAPISLTTTAAPAAPSCRAISRPMPPPAPVTTATLPSNRVAPSAMEILLLQLKSKEPAIVMPPTPRLFACQTDKRYSSDGQGCLCRGVRDFMRRPCEETDHLDQAARQRQHKTNSETTPKSKYRRTSS